MDTTVAMFVVKLLLLMVTLCIKESVEASGLGCFEMVKKKAEKEELKLDVHDKFFTKDGKYYVQKGVDDEDTIAFVQVNKKEYDKRVEELAKTLVEKSKLTTIQVVAQALRYLPLAELKKIEKNLKKKKKVTVEKGCVDLKCGNVEIPIC